MPAPRVRTPYDHQRHTGLQQHITVTIPAEAQARRDDPPTTKEIAA